MENKEITTTPSLSKLLDKREKVKKEIRSNRNFSIGMGIASAIINQFLISHQIVKESNEIQQSYANKRALAFSDEEREQINKEEKRADFWHFVRCAGRGFVNGTIGTAAMMGYEYALNSENRNKLHELDKLIDAAGGNK